MQVHINMLLISQFNLENIFSQEFESTSTMSLP